MKLVKEYDITPTAKQRLAVDNVSEAIRSKDNNMTIGQALIKSGYSKVTSESPTIVTKTKGFQMLCEEVGLTDNMILKAIADDIKQKPRDRSKELAIACKVKGLYKADNEQKDARPDIQDADFVEIIRAYRVRDKAQPSQIEEKL